MSFFLNSRLNPLSLWPIPSKGTFVSADHTKESPTIGATVGKYVKYFFVVLCFGVSIGYLFTRSRDIGIGAIIVAVYAGLFYIWRKTQPPKYKDRYPIIHYRGHPARKKKSPAKFFR